MKVLLTGFHFNGNTIGFHLQTQKLELHTKQIVPCESNAEEFHLNGNTTVFHPQILKSWANNLALTWPRKS